MRKETVDEIRSCLNLVVCLVVGLYVATALSGCAIDFNTAVRPVTSARSHENSYEPKKVRCLWGCNDEVKNEEQGS